MHQHLKAEIWDQVQYIFRNYYDRMIHCACYYDGKIDVGALRKSAAYLLEHYPVLRSTFRESPIKPHWTVNEDYSQEELVSVVYCDDLVKSVLTSLSEEISWKEKFQFRLVVHYCADKSAVSLLVNHMCMDGADFKYFVSKLTQGYNVIVQGGDITAMQLKSGNRGANQLYKDMTDEDAKAAKELMKNVSRTGVKNKFAFTDDTDCKVFFNFRKLGKDYVARLKEKGKVLGATLNDVLIAAYARAVSRYIEKSDDSRIAITCMKNLREHIKSGESEDLTNLTGFMPCVLDSIQGGFEDTLADVANKTKEAKDDKFCGLYGLPLMALAFKLFPYSIAEFAIKIGYENPYIGMSNIGLLPDDIVALDGLDCYDCFITGATKKKPYIQLTATTYRGETTLCIAQNCSQRDKEIIDKFFDEVIDELNTFVPNV